jgi:hypothetical protein
MQSTLTPQVTPQDTDPHDVFVIEPDVVLAARQASPDPVQELLSHLAHKAAGRSPEVSAAAPTPAVDTPTVDTTFRAAAIDKIDTTDRPVAPGDRPGISWWVKRAFIAFMFALCSAFAAAAWTHHGAAAKQMISSWLPPFVLAASPVSDNPDADNPVADKPAAAEQPDSAPAQAATADQEPAQPASVAQPADSAAPAAAASPAQSAPTTPSTESMARDLKTMGQQIEQLKASIEQLKASQAQMSRDTAKNSEAKNSEAKNSEPSSRPRAAAAFPPRPVAAIPPRSIPASPRKPKTAYLPPPAVITSSPPTYSQSPSYAVPPTLPPPPVPQSVVSQPVPLPEANVPSDDGPVIRPPMPLR